MPEFDGYQGTDPKTYWEKRGRQARRGKPKKDPRYLKRKFTLALPGWLHDAINFIRIEEEDRTGKEIKFPMALRLLLRLGILRWREIRRLPEVRDD